VRLFDGVPQQREAEAGAWRYFRFSVNPNGTTAFTVSVSPSLGNPDLFITSDGVLPSRTHFGWHADAVGEDAVTVDAHDAGWCASCSDRHDDDAAGHEAQGRRPPRDPRGDCSSCDYIIGVHAAQGAAAYTVTAATATSVVILENGVPHAGSTAAGGAEYYRLYLPAGGATGLRVTLTALSGEVAMYMAASSNTRPNATEHVWSSAPASASSGSTSTIVVPYDDATVAACLRRSSQCVLHLALVSPGGAAFTVLTNLEVLDMGLVLLAPEGPLQRSYVMAPAAF
jgi:hypothetical protein